MFVTAEEIQEVTTFSEVKELSDTQIDGYIERADSWIRRATNRDLSETDDSFIQADMRIATRHLVEYLVLWDDPEIKETMMGPDSGVRLGSYSVDYKNLSTWKDALPGEDTGIKELDNILARYRYRPTTGNLFQVFRKV